MSLDRTCMENAIKTNVLHANDCKQLESVLFWFVSVLCTGWPVNTNIQQYLGKY